MYHRQFWSIILKNIFQQIHTQANSRIDTLEFKYRYSICWQFILDRVLSSIAFFFHWLIFFRSSLSFSAELLIITVQYKSMFSAARCSYPVIRTFYRCKVNNKKHVILSTCRMSYKGENTSVTIIRIDPFKALRPAIIFIKTFITFI